MKEDKKNPKVELEDEKDIKEGNDVRINEYLKENQKKYNNKTSDLGYNFSKTVSKSLSKVI